MQLILAIDSDPRRSEQLANLVRARLSVDLVQATSAGEGLHALRDRVPDLILTSPLLSPFDDGVLDEYLRDLGAAATHVQTVRIPMLSSGPKKKSAAGRLFSLGRKKKQTSSAAPDGCDPKIFADEIAHYLTRSLEERSSSAKATEDKPATVMTSRVEAAAEPVLQPVADEWDAPEALVEQFREADPPMAAEPIAASTAAPRLRSVQAPPAIEQPHIPGSILDLRSPIVHAPEPEFEPPVIALEPPVVVEPETVLPEPEQLFFKPEPVFVKPEPVFVQPEPVFVKPEPVFVQPEPVFVQPEPLIEPEALEMHPAVKAFLEPEPPPVVEHEPVQPEPAALPAPKPVITPPPSTTTGTSASFEAALAAIRAAWEKPGPTASKPESKTPAAAPPATPAHRAKPLAASGEVDLTNEIDALEDVPGVDGSVPAADDDNSPDESKTPNARRKVEKPRKRPEKPRARSTRGPDGRDDWGVLDPKQYEFSALVNKLDEVTDSDEVTTRATNSR